MFCNSNSNSISSSFKFTNIICILSNPHSEKACPWFRWWCWVEGVLGASPPTCLLGQLGQPNVYMHLLLLTTTIINNTTLCHCSYCYDYDYACFTMHLPCNQQIMHAIMWIPIVCGVENSILVMLLTQLNGVQGNYCHTEIMTAAMKLHPFHNHTVNIYTF